MEDGILSPCIIGATGGSGTRVVAQIVQAAGMFLGVNLNISEDALNVARFLDRWINPYMAREASPLSKAQQARMVREFQLLLKRHCSPLQESRGPFGWMSWPWEKRSPSNETLGLSQRQFGWKEPRSIYLLPFLHSQCSGLKFLHVVRDGRDMAFSTNQNQVRKHGQTLLGRSEEQLSPPLRSIALWSRVNLLAAEYGESRLPTQYLRIRFEDLCDEPVAMVRRIFDFFHLHGDLQQIASSIVSPPETLGRWKARDQETITQLHLIGRTALQRFGYLGNDQPNGLV